MEQSAFAFALDAFADGTQCAWRSCTFPLYLSWLCQSSVRGAHQFLWLLDRGWLVLPSLSFVAVYLPSVLEFKDQWLFVGSLRKLMLRGFLMTRTRIWSVVAALLVLRRMLLVLVLLRLSGISRCLQWTLGPLRAKTQVRELPDGRRGARRR